MALMPVSKISVLVVSSSKREPDGGWDSTPVHLGHRLAVDGLAHDVPDAAERLGANGHLHGLTGIGGDEAALQAVGRGHGDGADDAARKLALDLEDRHGVTDGVSASTVSAL